jgi:predicted nucleotidyltransferase
MHADSHKPPRPPNLIAIPDEVGISLLSLRDDLINHGLRIEDLLVVGAIAVDIYGRSRYSLDLDVAVALSDEKTEEALFAVIKNPNRYTIISPDRGTKRDDPALDTPSDLENVRLVRLRNKHTGIQIGILLVNDEKLRYGVDRKSFTRAREFHLGDNDTILLPSPENLILMKLYARRGGDKSDASDIFSIILEHSDDLDGEFLHEQAKELDREAVLNFYKNEVANVRAREREARST